MLSFLKLCNLLLVALGASVGCGNLGFGNISSAGMGIAVAGIATHSSFTVMALLPVGNDVWSLLAVATDALLAAVRGMDFLKRN